MRRHVAWLAACAVLLGTMAACDPVIGAAPGVSDRCRVKFASPYRPIVTSGRIIRGSASVLCTGPVDFDHAVLHLQRKSPTGWNTRDSDRSDTIPYPAAVTLLVLVPCAPGTWQLAYDVQASYQGTTAHGTNASDPLTVTAHADCGVAR